VRCDLGPGTDPDTVGLGQLHVEVRVGLRLAVAPHTLLERACQLRPVRFTDQVGPLMIERRVQEEAVVVEPEVLLGLADTAFAKC